MADRPTANPDVRIVDVEILSDDWCVLQKATFDHRSRDGDGWNERSAARPRRRPAYRITELHELRG